MHYNDGSGVLTADAVYLYHGVSFSTDDGFGSGTPSWYIDPSVTKVDITTTSQSPVLMASGPSL